MSNTTSSLIDRNEIPQDLRGKQNPQLVNDFIALRIDYRTMGSLKQQTERMRMDHDSIGYWSEFTGQRNEVDDAFCKYLKLIRNGYKEITESCQ